MLKSAVIDLTNNSDVENESISDNESGGSLKCFSCKNKVLNNNSKTYTSKSDNIKTAKKIKTKKQDSTPCKKKDLIEAHRQRRKSKQETLSYVININTKINKGKSKKFCTKSGDCIVNSHCKCCKCLKDKFTATSSQPKPLKKVNRGYIQTVLDDSSVPLDFERPVPKCLRQCTLKIRQPLSDCVLCKSPLTKKHGEPYKCTIIPKLNKKHTENKEYPQISTKCKNIIDEIVIIDGILSKKQISQAKEPILRDATCPRQMGHRKKRSSRTFEELGKGKATAKNKTKKCQFKKKIKSIIHNSKTVKEQLINSISHSDLSDISEESFKTTTAQEAEMDNISLSSISVTSMGSPTIHEIDDESVEEVQTRPSSSDSTLILGHIPTKKASRAPHLRKTSPPRRSNSCRQSVKSAKTPTNYIANRGVARPAKLPTNDLANRGVVRPAKSPTNYLANCQVVKAAKPPTNYLANCQVVKAAKPPTNYLANCQVVKAAKPPTNYLANCQVVKAAKPPTNYLANRQVVKAAKAPTYYLANRQVVRAAKPPTNYLANHEVVDPAKLPTNYLTNIYNSEYVGNEKIKPLTTESQFIPQAHSINPYLINNNWQSYQMPINHLISYIRHNIEISTLNLERLKNFAQNSTETNLQYCIPTRISQRHQVTMMHRPEYNLENNSTVESNFNIGISDKAAQDKDAKNDDPKSNPEKTILISERNFPMNNDNIIEDTSQTKYEANTNIITASCTSKEEGNYKDILPKTKTELAVNVLNNQALLSTTKTEVIIKIEEPTIKEEELIIKKEEPIIKKEEPMIKKEEPKTVEENASITITD